MSCLLPGMLVASGVNLMATAAHTTLLSAVLQAPVNLPASVGVVVEEGPGCYLVKVNCKDRRGLLSDITAALRGLPLQVGITSIKY